MGKIIDFEEARAAVNELKKIDSYSTLGEKLKNSPAWQEFVGDLYLKAQEKIKKVAKGKRVVKSKKL
jgi:hypothetical protein